MFIVANNSRRGRPARPGVVLLVVIAMLALFAALGLSFVYYAQFEADAANLSTQAQTQSNADVDPELLVSYFLGQLLYDTDNLNSALRGHSLTRLVYGQKPSDTANPQQSQNFIPFNGYGRLRYPLVGAANAPPNNFEAVNYQYFRSDNFRRDPEHYGLSLLPTDPTSRGPYLGGANVPWTYPDLNNMFLAAVNANGEVLQPSYHRAWTGVDFTAGGDLTQKYRTLSPHVCYNPNFPAPTFGGHVKNLDNSPGTRNGASYDNNDSFWIDVGFPVLMAPNGKKYKPLFAPLIIDLDGKLNLNAAGNIRGAGDVHASNHGWGPWEINLAKVLNHANASDMVKLIKQYRYGGNGPLDGMQSLPAGPIAPAPYARVDIDGVKQPPPLTPSVKMEAPWHNTFPYPKFYGMPYFDPASYGNNVPMSDEGKNHPRLYNPLAPQAGDRKLDAYHLEALLRYGGTGSPALSSNLFLTNPFNFGDASDPNTARRRRLVTTHSMDFGLPGLSPWLSRTPPSDSYQLGPGATYPTGGAVSSPTLPLFAIDGEFNSDGRGFNPFLTKLNLNRTFTAYPIDPATGRIDIINNAAAYGLAVSDRKQLAQDIFERLRFVTTGHRPTTPPVFPMFPPQGSPEYNALRWLAQLAVNMVDFLDSDDIMTGFNWDAVPGGPPTNQWVFGTELPRVLINEAYVEHVRPGSATPRGMAVGFNNRVLHYAWVELYNPHIADPSLSDGGDARLHMVGGAPGANYPIYRVVIAQLDLVNPAKFLAPDNTLGDPSWNDPGAIYDSAGVGGGMKAIVDDFMAKPVLKAGPNPPFYASPVGTNDVTFYVLGPDQVPEQGGGMANINFPGNQVTATHKRPEMAFKTDPPPGGPAFGLVRPNFVLQRLANPGLPKQDVPNLPNYNPYVTVDYTPETDNNDEDQNGFSGKKAKGRRQPNAADASQWVFQNPDTDPGMAGVQPYMNQPQHTFFRHNGEEANPPPSNSAMLQQPFDWLLHLDRHVLSPMELYHVSAFKPTDLTHQFMTPAKRCNHLPPWLDTTTNSRLYRFFEHVDAGSRAGHPTFGSVSFSGRIPGKININTVWDKEILAALIDPQAASLAGFDTDALFTQLESSRYGRDPITGMPLSTFSAYGKPFKSLATGTFPAGDTQSPGGGISDTLLRPHPNDPTKFLFEVPPPAMPPPGSDNPFTKMELLNKIFNNVTTRSNCFAVWVTVGFFEVEDDSVIPAKLGKEIGKDDNRHVRHRMFTIIDRTELALFERPASAAIAVAPNSSTTMPINNLVPGGIGTNRMNGKTFTIEEGMLLTIDTGANTEEVVVKRNPTTSILEATFFRNHAAGATITARGNPGPIPRYDVRRDTNVVLYYSVIQ